MYLYQVNDLYQFIYHVDDPSLMFVGFARPTLFSLFTVAETQSRHVAEVLIYAVSRSKCFQECQLQIHLRTLLHRWV